MNGLRGRVRVQVDGQLKTGRDVAFAALLGAEEFGFATAPLVASGCVMMRKCHLNTCPVGVATQDPVLRARFAGTPEHVINYFFFVAEELRAIMARSASAPIDEMVGRADCIVPRPPRADELPARAYRKARRLDFAELLIGPRRRRARRCAASRRRSTTSAASSTTRSSPKRARRAQVRARRRRSPSTSRNADRAFGAMLAGEIARRYGAGGLPDDTIVIERARPAGQSFGAFATRGHARCTLEGDANDYVGKGLSGGMLAIAPPRASRPSAPDEQRHRRQHGALRRHEREGLLRGRAGERFAVRNSGATAVVEGVGDHGCEYMTGGTVVVLGPTGRNFAAGMSGGVAYVLDEDGLFARRCNTAMVELEPVDGEDATTLRALVEEHARRTGSARRGAAGRLGRDLAQDRQGAALE